MTRRTMNLLLIVLLLIAVAWYAMSLSAADPATVGAVPTYTPPAVVCCEIPQPPARPTAYPYPYPEPPQPPYRGGRVFMPITFESYPAPAYPGPMGVMK